MLLCWRIWNTCWNLFPSWIYTVAQEVLCLVWFSSIIMSYWIILIIIPLKTETDTNTYLTSTLCVKKARKTTKTVIDTLIIEVCRIVIGFQKVGLYIMQCQYSTLTFVLCLAHLLAAYQLKSFYRHCKTQSVCLFVKSYHVIIVPLHKCDWLIESHAHTYEYDWLY